jgi:hypothetical protein
MQTIRNLIQSAERGYEGSETVLRSIIRLAADKAPKSDVIRIAEFLAKIRDEAEETN